MPEPNIPWTQREVCPERRPQRVALRRAGKCPLGATRAWIRGNAGLRHGQGDQELGKFESFFDTRCVERDRPGEIPSIGMIHSVRGGPGEKIVGLQVIKACRVIAEVIIIKVVLDKRLDGGREEVRKKV